MSFSRFSLLAICAAFSMSAALPAFAASSSFASISNFTISSSGGTDFINNQPVVYMRVIVSDNLGNPLDKKINVTPTTTPVTARFEDAFATTSITGDGFDTANFMAEGGSNSDKHYDAISFASLRFTLAGHTSITFGALSSLSTNFNKTLGEYGFAGTYFEIRDALPTSSVFTHGINMTGLNSENKNLQAIYSNDTDTAVTKMLVIGAFVQGESFPVTPVPEPETYAMLLAGLGVLGAVARRRKAQANA
ncbi:PEP-CTERM protein-sorting domain [Comamonadaceae bacterium]